MSFKPNQSVQQISDDKIRGIVTGNSRTFADIVYVEIEIDGHERRFVVDADLAPLIAAPTGVEDRLRNLYFGTLGDLARVLTYHKISSNLSNVYYAMQASRTEFHAYQFKAVYKFIESLNGRVLIADEVGLGKTIEAGLIWLEAQARSDAKRLLVVCPPMLREKWKQELKFRFNTKAEIHDAKGFRSLLDDFQREGNGFQCAAVCSLNSIRQDSVQAALKEFESAPYKFDLVVIDEAHHLRNSSTKSHAVGRILSEISEAVVLLTATPIHLGNQDLYRLLNLLDSNEFSELWQFERIIEENEPIVIAQNLLRQHPPRIADARDQLIRLIDYPSFGNNSNLQRSLGMLDSLDSKNYSSLVEVGLLLEKLNLLSSHISRTRKREVSEWRVTRESKSLAVRFTENEMSFYQAVTRSVQDRIERFSENKVAAFALMMPQRQMASCIPAMVEFYRNDLRGQTEVDAEILEGLGVFDNESDKQLAVDSWLELDQIVDEWKSDTPDSKFDVLLNALKERFQREPDVKVIVFSYFKKTLAYLNRRLSEAGFGPVVIHGGVPMDDRTDLIERFKSDPKRRVLLSSEVGAEGIDLQFCRVMFNYDLPWNPMKVEQRIGRIDRLGQKAEKISIVNFAVGDTIEEKILNRLYDRIGIFERSLGDLEPILGELTQQLSFDLLSRRLSPEQETRRIEQTLLATENRRQQEESLAEQSTVFLGSADYILEQIGVARELGRRITSDDLKRFVQDFFETHDYFGSTVTWDRPEPGMVSIKLSPKARADLHSYCRNHNPPMTTILSSGANATDVLVIDSELAQASPSLEMLTHFHPLIQWIRQIHSDNPDAFSPTSAVEVSSDAFSPGDYLIVVQFWTFEGVKQSRRIEYEVVQLDGADLVSDRDSERLLREILEHGSTWEFARLKTDPDALMAAWNACNERILGRYESAFQTFAEDNNNLREKRLSYLESFSARKEESLTKAIHTMQSQNATENKLRPFYKMIENRQKQTLHERALLQAQSKLSKHFQELAAVVCHISK
jgi:superfamily II DNA or RNA helicase